MLLKLELLQLLISDLLFNYFLLRDLDYTHFNYKIWKSSVSVFIIISFWVNTQWSYLHRGGTEDY